MNRYITYMLSNPTRAQGFKKAGSSFHKAMKQIKTITHFFKVIIATGTYIMKNFPMLFVNTELEFQS